MAVFSFLLLAEEDKFEPHPSIAGQTSQSILEDTLLIRGARFVFRKKNKTGEGKKEKTIKKIVQQQNGVSLLY